MSQAKADDVNAADAKFLNQVADMWSREGDAPGNESIWALKLRDIANRLTVRDNRLTVRDDRIRVLTEILVASKAEQQIRERLANNGRNTANNNAGIRVGSDLHLCEVLLAQINQARAALQSGSLSQLSGPDD